MKICLNSQSLRRVALSLHDTTTLRELPVISAPLRYNLDIWYLSSHKVKPAHSEIPCYLITDAQDVEKQRRFVEATRDAQSSFLASLRGATGCNQNTGA